MDDGRVCPAVLFSNFSVIIGSLNFVLKVRGRSTVYDRTDQRVLKVKPGLLNKFNLKEVWWTFFSSSCVGRVLSVPASRPPVPGLKPPFPNWNPGTQYVDQLARYTHN